MFSFIGKLLLLIAFAFMIGLVTGSLMASPEIGVAAFLIFAASFRGVVFQNIPRE
jgi:hypothetical protein